MLNRLSSIEIQKKSMCGGNWKRAGSSSSLVGAIEGKAQKPSFRLQMVIVSLWRLGNDGAQQSYECAFKSHVRCNLQVDPH